MVLTFPGYLLAESGNGTEYGEDALKEYLQFKAVHVNLTASPPI
jgi:hypothetical protein